MGMINFDRLANQILKATGSKWATLTAFILVIIWILAGPYFHFSDTYQLVANTFTTLVTFIIGFVIMYNANHNDIAIHLKLDEIIKGVENARNEFTGIEEKTEEEILKLKKDCKDGSL